LACTNIEAKYKVYKRNRLVKNEHTEFIPTYKFNYTRGQGEVYVMFG